MRIEVPTNYTPMLKSVKEQQYRNIERIDNVYDAYIK